MNQDKFRIIKKQLVPDEIVIEKLYRKIEQEPSVNKSHRYFLIKMVPIAACFLILLLGIIFNNMNQLSSNIKGLSVDNYKISGGGSTASIIRIDNLMQLFGFELDCFLIVKVTDIQNLESENKQIAKVKVLESLYKKNKTNVSHVTLYTLPFNPMIGSETVSTLRKNGVYILPIKEQNGEYVVEWSLHVLFEIDNWGNVYSHSNEKCLNRFDGKPYSILTREIKEMANDDMFILASSHFGEYVLNVPLAEIVIMSEHNEEKDDHDMTIVNYKAKVKQTFNNNNIPEDINLKFYNYNQSRIILNKGSRYLMFLDEYEKNYGINPQDIALINDDDVIECLYSEYENPFIDYEGYTVDQIKELADLVNKYGKKAISKYK